MQIHYAAKRGDREAVARQLARGVFINAPNEADGETPLMWAARSSKTDADFLHFLIEQGADINAVSSQLESTALFGAVHADSMEKVRFLLGAGADVRYRNANGYTALLGGVPASPDVTRLLLESGAEPDGVTPWGESTLSVASRESDWPVVRMLLEFGADPAPLEWTPLMRATALGSLQDMEAELSAGGDLTARDRWERTPWLLAVCAGDIPKAEALRAHSAEKGVAGRGGDTALMYAAKRNDVPMLEWLLAQGADVREVTGFGDTALHEAASRGSAEACRVLLAAGADVHAINEVRAQPISDAALEVVRVLVEAGADINFVDGTGEWSLKRAAGEGDLEGVRGLLGLGASVETTSTGETALHGAVNADELEIMRLLLDAGADPNAQDVDQCGTLWYARTTEAVQILLDAGVDVHLVDEMGREALLSHADTEIQAQLIAAGCAVNPPDAGYGTPLITAAGGDSLEQVRFLLAQGADVNATTSWGKTALMEACEHSFSPCVQALLATGAGVEARDEQRRTAAFHAAAPEAFEAYGTYLQTKERLGRGDREDAPDFVDREWLAQAKDIVGAWRPDPADYGYTASDSLESLELLAQAGADINARDAQGLTPLMLAASCGRPARVAGLLALGANSTLHDAGGKTARDHAEAHPDGEQRAAIQSLLT